MYSSISKSIPKYQKVPKSTQKSFRSKYEECYILRPKSPKTSLYIAPHMALFNERMNSGNTPSSFYSFSCPCSCSCWCSCSPGGSTTVVVSVWAPPARPGLTTSLASTKAGGDSLTDHNSYTSRNPIILGRTQFTHTSPAGARSAPCWRTRRSLTRRWSGSSTWTTTSWRRRRPPAQGAALPVSKAGRQLVSWLNSVSLDWTWETWARPAGCLNTTPASWLPVHYTDLFQPAGCLYTIPASWQQQSSISASWLASSELRWAISNSLTMNSEKIHVKIVKRSAARCRAARACEDDLFHQKPLQSCPPSHTTTLWPGAPSIPIWHQNGSKSKQSKLGTNISIISGLWASVYFSDVH